MGNALYLLCLLPVLLQKLRARWAEQYPVLPNTAKLGNVRETVSIRKCVMWSMSHAHMIRCL